MASRQQRRNSEREIRSDAHVPGVWWKQEGDVDVVVRAFGGANAVREKAAEGNANALYALGVMIKIGMETPPTDGVDTRWSEVHEGEGLDSLMTAAEQGHVYASEFMADMFRLSMANVDMSRGMYAKTAQQGLPSGMFKLARSLESGEGGVLEIDAPAAAEWYRRAAGAGHAYAAINLSIMRESGRGVLRSKRFAMTAMRKAAENGSSWACTVLAETMFVNEPYARRVGRIKREDFKHATSVDDYANTDSILNHMVEEISETENEEDGSIVPSIVEWLRRCEAAGGVTMTMDITWAVISKKARDGAKYCRNAGCEIVDHLKKFKVCPKCKCYRYCGPTCQKADWYAGGHMHKCCTYEADHGDRRPGQNT